MVSYQEVIAGMPKWFWVLTAFSYGAIIGSFNNVLIYRLPREMSIVFPPSHCPVCKRKLKPWHNIPIISYILLRGRCAYCGAPIPIRYLVVEVLTATAFALSVAYFGLSLQALKWIIFSAIAIPIIFIDWEWQIIPDELNLAMALGGITYLALLSLKHKSTYPLIMGIGNGILYALTFALIYYLGRLVFKKEALGIGDIKLAFGLGLFLIYPHLTFTSMFLSFFIGAVVGGALFIYKATQEKKKLGKLHDKISWEAWTLGLLSIPLGDVLREYWIYQEDVRNSFYVAFGPFLILGTLIAGIWGDKLIRWYLQTILGIY